MKFDRRRLSLIAAFITTVLIAAGIYLKLNQLSHVPPNYSEIEDGLWIGGLVPKPPPGTKTVLNLCESEDTFQVELNRWMPIPDIEPAPSLDWLREQVQFVASERATGRGVFVHCRAGVNRSAMLMAAYLMQREKWTRDQALEYIRTKRPSVKPHPAYMLLLLEWEHSINVK